MLDRFLDKLRNYDQFKDYTSDLESMISNGLRKITGYNWKGALDKL